MELRLEHPSNESNSTEILFGSSIEIREEQPEKALALIDISADKITDVRFVLSLNASLLIEVTLYVADSYEKLAGIVIEFLLAPEALSPLTMAE